MAVLESKNTFVIKRNHLHANWMCFASQPTKWLGEVMLTLHWIPLGVSAGHLIVQPREHHSLLPRRYNTLLYSHLHLMLSLTGSVFMARTLAGRNLYENNSFDPYV